MLAVRAATWRDVGLSLFLFLGPPVAGILIRILRELREIRRVRRRDQTEAEAIAAEGFPPAAPTHHRQPDASNG